MNGSALLLAFFCVASEYILPIVLSKLAESKVSNWTRVQAVIKSTELLLS